MKLLIITTLALCTMNTYAWDKESATELYNLNKETFPKKEIMLSPSLCSLQNELAEVANKEKYDCVPNRASSVDDTSKGDRYVQQTLKEANRKMFNLQNQFNESENQIIDNAFKEMNVEI